MKFTAQFLSALAAAGLLASAISAPAFAGKKAPKKDPTLVELIDADLKALDKAIFGPPPKAKKK